MMSELGALEGLQALHRELLAACEHRFENVEWLEQLLLAHSDAFKKLLDKPARDAKSRSAVQSGWFNLFSKIFNTEGLTTSQGRSRSQTKNTL
jgi:hypothetical protein